MIPPGDGQAGSPGFDGFHKHEVHGIALVGCDLDAGARDHFVERAIGKFAVVPHRSDVEERMILRDIGATVRDEPIDELLHLFDVLGRARLDIGLQAPKRGHVLVELALGGLRDLSDRFVEREVWILLRCARINLCRPRR